METGAAAAQEEGRDGWPAPHPALPSPPQAASPSTGSPWTWWMLLCACLAVIVASVAYSGRSLAGGRAASDQGQGTDASLAAHKQPLPEKVRMMQLPRLKMGTPSSPARFVRFYPCSTLHTVGRQHRHHARPS